MPLNVLVGHTMQTYIEVWTF